MPRTFQAKIECGALMHAWRVTLCQKQIADFDLQTLTQQEDLSSVAVRENQFRARVCDVSFLNART